MQAYEEGLERRQANYVPLTPVDLVARAAEVYGDRLAIVYGDVRRTWRQTYMRARQLASALGQKGVGYGDTVTVMLPNIPPAIEAHFGVPMLGAVLNTVNTRLDADAVLFMLRHGEAKSLIIDTEFSALARRIAIELPELHIIYVADVLPADSTYFPRATDYETFIAMGDPEFTWVIPRDEWDTIALNYTSGTTGTPKGVVYHYRGAYLNAICNILEWDMPKHPVYLWVLPLYHCNGWCFAWTIAARAGVNVCLRKFDVSLVFDLIRREHVTHYCGAPIVQAALADTPTEWRKGINHTVHTMMAGSAPAPAIITRIKAIGFSLTHVYGLTEVFGPTTVCVEQEGWKHLSEEEQSELKARQGVRNHFQSGVEVLDVDTMESVPADGKTVGEIVIRGNICMKGYLKNENATEAAFTGGWFHTGDLGVMFPDGYVHITDRKKDIIVSGGENISSIEIENALYRHSAVSVVAVVAMPDIKWGEVPCAFVELKSGISVTKDELIVHCRALLAGYKIPQAIYFGEIPKTFTGKIHKVELRKRLQLR